MAPSANRVEKTRAFMLEPRETDAATGFYIFALERDQAVATLTHMKAPRAAAGALALALLMQGSAFARGGHPGHGGHPGGGWRPHAGASVIIRAPAYVHPVAPRPRVYFSAPIIAAPLVAAPLYYSAPVVYPPPVYAPPSVTYYSSPPQQYIEQAPPAATAQADASQWWYFCAGSRTYYPYVKECPGGWQRVSPTPPAL
jgi:hypothetical protein